MVVNQGEKWILWRQKVLLMYFVSLEQFRFDAFWLLWAIFKCCFCFGERSWSNYGPASMNWNTMYKIYEDRRFSDCLLLLFLWVVGVKKIRCPHSWGVGIGLRVSQLSSILRHNCLHIQYKNWNESIPLTHSCTSLLNYDSLHWSAIDRGQINSNKVCGWGRISNWGIWRQFEF